MKNHRAITDLENSLVTKYGDVIWVTTNAIPNLDEYGNLTGYPGTFTDISARKQSELALQVSELRYSQLFENSQDAVLITWPDGKIENVRPLSDLIQDVLLVPLYGHTLGHQGVAIPSEKALFCGDAFMHSSQIEKKAGEEALILKAYNQVAVINQPEFKVTLEQLRNFKKTNLDWEISCSHS